MLYLATKDLLINMSTYMKNLMKYSDIWTLDKREQLIKFQSIPHNADSIDNKIMLYEKQYIHFKTYILW